MKTTNESLALYYAAHIKQMQNQTKAALKRENLQGLVIHSGQLKKTFLDDNTYPFKVNPHFKHWLPITEVPNSWLVVNGADKPILIYYLPVDFWHKVTPLANSYWSEFFEVKILNKASDVDKLLPYDKKSFAYIGEHIEVATALGFEQINPADLLNYIHYHRAYKSKYEQECLRYSNELAVSAHVQARNGFYEGKSEYEIQHIYLNDLKYTANETPYNNIIALNEHCSILHYMSLQTTRPKKHQSLLIDAGANFNGYASDITRTYAKEGNMFAELIKAVNKLTLETVAQVKPGKSYVDLHNFTYRGIGQILCDFNIIQTSLEIAIESGIISTFFPHGVGHHLGLQVHDVGGYMADERGTLINAPKQHTFLRNTRVIETNQVLTIEPGLYFIDSLLAELKSSNKAELINWQKVETMKAFGGIRIEDNIIVHQSHNENMTRESGLT